MRPRSTASAQTGRSGQEGRQASMTSAEGRGPAATHSTGARISGSCAADMTTPPDDRGEASLPRKTPSPHIHPSTAGAASAASAALAYLLPPLAPPLSPRDPKQTSRHHRHPPSPVSQASASPAPAAPFGPAPPLNTLAL